MIDKKIKILIGKTERGGKKVIATSNITIGIKMLKHLNFNELDNMFTFYYKQNRIELKKGFTEEEFIKQTSSGLELKKNTTLYKSGRTYKLSIPLNVLVDMEVTEDDRDIFLKLEDNSIVFYRKSKKGVRRNSMKGKVITIKVNKGGVGKSFLTAQLGVRLSELGYKVLTLTSDSQNNIHFYLTPYNKDGEKPLETSEGLKVWVNKGEGYKVKLRENLDFIPLENSIFSTQFFLKLPAFIEKMREEYDFILIDSIPTIRIDSEFVKCSDKIIVPAFADGVTVDGVIKVVKEAGVEKVFGILINKYENKITQKGFLDKLKKALEGTEILLPTPIKNLSKIEFLLNKGKSIYESQDSSLKEAKESIDCLVEGLIAFKETPIVEDELDIDF